MIFSLSFAFSYASAEFHKTPNDKNINNSSVGSNGSNSKNNTRTNVYIFPREQTRWQRDDGDDGKRKSKPNGIGISGHCIGKGTVCVCVSVCLRWVFASLFYPFLSCIFILHIFCVSTVYVYFLLPMLPLPLSPPLPPFTNILRAYSMRHIQFLSVFHKCFFLSFSDSVVVVKNVVTLLIYSVREFARGKYIRGRVNVSEFRW